MRAVAIGLMLFFLSGSLIDFREWSKLPELAAHFEEHRAKNPTLSFSQFLFLHYGAGSDQHRQEEPAQHEQLPFGATANIMSVFFCPQSQPVMDAGSFLALPRSFNFYESSLVSTQASQSIWQPPRA
jgi:hypothetical protein